MVPNAWLLLLMAFSWQLSNESTRQASLARGSVEDVAWGDWQEDVRCGIRYGEDLYQLEIHIQNKGKDSAYLIRPTLRLCPSHSGQQSCFETKIKTGYVTISGPAFLVVPKGSSVDRGELVRDKQAEDVEKKYINSGRIWTKVPAGDSYKQTLVLAYSKWRIDSDSNQYILPPVFPILHPKTIPVGHYTIQLQTGLLAHVDLRGPVRSPRRNHGSGSDEWLDNLPKMKFPALPLRIPDPSRKRVDLFAIENPVAWRDVANVGSTTTIDFRASVVVKGNYYAWGLKVAPPREISLFNSDENGNPVGRRLALLRNDGKKPDAIAGDMHYSESVKLATGSEVGRLSFIFQGESDGAMPFSSRMFFIEVLPEWVPTGPYVSKGRPVETPDGVLFVSDEVVVSFKKGTNYDAIKRVFDRIGGRVVKYSHLSKIWIVKIPDTSDGSGVFFAVRILLANPLVMIAEPNVLSIMPQ